MADVCEKEGERIASVMEKMIEKSRLFTEAIDNSDIFTMTELFLDLEYEHLMLLSDTVNDPDLKTQILQAALIMKSSSESSRFFPPVE